MKNIDHIIIACSKLDIAAQDFFLTGIATWGNLTPRIIEIIAAYVAMDQDSKDFAHVAMSTWAELNPAPSIGDKPIQKLFLVSNIGK
jgi:hypothetical protein